MYTNSLSNDQDLTWDLLHRSIYLHEYGGYYDYTKLDGRPGEVFKGELAEGEFFGGEFLVGDVVGDGVVGGVDFVLDKNTDSTGSL